MNRRRFISNSLSFSSALLVPSVLNLFMGPGRAHAHHHDRPAPAPHPHPPSPPSRTGPTGPIALDFELQAVPESFHVYSDRATEMWRFRVGTVTAGASQLSHIPGSFLGPTLELRQGQRLRVKFVNSITQASIIHWHGLDVPMDQDGHPHSVVGPGDSYQYDFVIPNRAGLYFYHPHPHGKVGEQVNRGLVGLLRVRDDEEDALGLPADENEHLIALIDRRVNADRQFEYMTGGGHDHMMGMHGNTLLINGQTQAPLKVKRGWQRLRIANLSNARIYNLQWSDGRPLSIIGTDGGLLESAETRQQVLLSPAERLDVLVDLSKAKEGDQLSLQSAPLVAGRGSPFDLIQLHCTSEIGAAWTMPQTLCRFDRISESEAINAAPGSEKIFTLGISQQEGWTIDALPYEPGIVRAKETVRFGDTEIWEFDNSGTHLPHPIHIHGASFQVLSRTSGSFTGAFDLGWKDTVLLLPGDRVRLIKRFNTHKGDFLFHCHNLEHEDHAMMRDFRIL
ncbi:MAG TPA: multicopper oxidase family protein [Pseudobdellovibrionaceae bacterium]|nr:multicopper oxidase family protein [Pseudobdellovibrionaceae bacterium]